MEQGGGRKIREGRDSHLRRQMGYGHGIFPRGTERKKEKTESKREGENPCSTVQFENVKGGRLFAAVIQKEKRGKKGRKDLFKKRKRRGGFAVVQPLGRKAKGRVRCFCGGGEKVEDKGRASVIERRKIDDFH